LGLRAKLAHIWPRDNSSNNLHDLATNPNGSTFLWLPQDEYSGDTFFECVFRKKQTLSDPRLQWIHVLPLSRSYTVRVPFICLNLAINQSSVHNQRHCRVCPPRVHATRF
jgi:hypothetical protein